jgi:Ca2+-binding EF-hand superfamily protein
VHFRETYKTINEVKAAFKKFDKNSDGSLSKTELARMMYRYISFKGRKMGIKIRGIKIQVTVSANLISCTVP